MDKPIIMIAEFSNLFDLIPDVVFTDGLHNVIERQQQAFFLKRRTCDGLAVRKFRWRTGGQCGHDLAFQVPPGEGFGLHLDVRVQGLKPGDDIGDRFP